MTVRILVTVSRSWSSWTVMREALQRCYEKHPGAVLVHGAAPNGDSDAAGIWRGLGGSVQPWPATAAAPNRNAVCRFAGYRRNVAMVESAPDLCLAFIRNKSKGATHCAQAAEDAGIPVVRYVQGGAA